NSAPTITQAFALIKMRPNRRHLHGHRDDHAPGAEPDAGRRRHVPGARYDVGHLCGRSDPLVLRTLWPRRSHPEMECFCRISTALRHELHLTTGNAEAALHRLRSPWRAKKEASG